MDRVLIHKLAVIGAGMIATYAMYMMLIGISGVWQTSQSFYQGADPYYPYLFTGAVASVPFVLFVITYLIHKNTKPVIAAILTAYSLLVYLSYPTILLVIIVATWWALIQRGGASPNKSLNTDAQKARAR
jgi:hypothetical protein